VKKLRLKGLLRNKKPRLGFHFYFVLFVALVLMIAIGASSYLAQLTGSRINLIDNVDLEELVILTVYSLILGIIMSVFVGMILIGPIKKLRSSMNEVAKGNFDTEPLKSSKIDEIDDLNYAFNLMMKELRANETMQADFIANVSHEFKTPLAAIEGYATLLQDEGLTNAERAEYEARILSSTRRMNELVGNILLLSKLDNQAIESKKEEFSLDEQIRQVIVMLEPKWSAKNTELDVELDGVTYYGNAGVTSHVWSNLIGNAIKFGPDGGKIKIRLGKTGEEIVFIVEDEGEGIAEGDLEHVFDKFYQADTSHKAEGNGLGLALVKRIIDVLGGEVKAENLDKGCRFTVILR